MNNVEFKLELDRIELIEDPEEQGYQTAPIIQLMTGAPIEILLQSALDKPFTDETNSKRDAGFIRWCHEQLGVH